MSPKKKETKDKPKKYPLAMTWKALILWCLGSFFLLVWIFILGVLVGSGNLSFGIIEEKFFKILDMSEEDKSEEDGSKEDRAEGKAQPEADLATKPEEDPKLAFYEELSLKKEEAVKNSPPSPQPQVVSTDSRGKHEETPETMTPPPRKGVDQYVLQIGFFGDRAKAASLVKRLCDRGFPAYFSNASMDGKLYYRVKCGPFETEKKADEFKITLAKKEGIHGFVTRADK